MDTMDRCQLPPEKLRWTCDPESLGFECTEDLSPLQGFVGQERAIRAIEFGLEVEKAGYNLFVTGLTGTGKATIIKSYLRRLIEQRQQSGTVFEVFDWCYRYNFKEPDKPSVLKMPRGAGLPFREHIQRVLRELQEEIPKAFSSEEYLAQRQQIVEQGQSSQQAEIQALEREAMQRSFVVQFTTAGVTLVPLLDGKPITAQEFMSMPESRRKVIEDTRTALLKRVEEVTDKVRAIARETRNKLEELDRSVGEFNIGRLFREVEHEYREFPQVVSFIEDLKAYTLSHLELFKSQEMPETPQPAPADPPLSRPFQPDPFLPFQINVFVDNSGTEGPPIVIEPNPTWGNLFGKIERRAFMGTYISDHTMLKAGSLQRANGGYLVVNAQDVLLNPGVWPGLKRAIRTRELGLEDPAEQLGILVPQGLRPQPVPLDVKVIITGDEQLYRLLSTLDREDFSEMFKVKAEFDYQIERTPENIQAYASFVCGTCISEGLRHFDRGAVAKVLEYGAWAVSDQTRLSARFGQVKDLIIEADYWARKNGHRLVNQEDVQRALTEKIYRLNLIEERIRSLIVEGTLMVDVEGEVVGQVNGLVFYDLGDFSFGRPARITAQTFAGRRGVINIERESQLSGPIHNKAVLILSGYLGWKYAQDLPLSLSASLCFEQSYSGVEGDSATAAELYAILSSLSGLPLKQYIAVTGSVNQKGVVQPVGGVTQKIEGFFDVCRVLGLTGRQGVIVPHQNVKNLMLREDVVDAVREGKFHIYAIKTIDEGLEILTGVPAGERQPDGTYPPGTINALVDARLRELSKNLQGYYASLLEQPGS